MPIINIELTADIDKQQHENIAQETTRIMGEILQKDTQLTAVTIKRIERENWFIGGRNLNQRKKESAFIYVKISQGTNTSEQKSAAIKAFYKLLNDQAGPLDNTSYVTLDEISTNNWGYGGKTQKARQIKRNHTGDIDTNHYLNKGKQERSIRITQLISSIFKTPKRKPSMQKNA